MTNSDLKKRINDLEEENAHLKEKVEKLKFNISQFKNKDLLYLQNIIEALPEYIYWKDTNLNYRGCNKKVSDYLGLSSSDAIIGKSDDNFDWSEERIRALHEIDKEVIKYEINNVVEDIIPDDKGNERIMLTSKSPMYDDEGNTIGLVGVSTDITELKNYERELVAAKDKALVASKAKTEFLANMSHDIRTPLVGIIGGAEILKLKLKDPELKDFVSDMHLSGKKLMEFFDNTLELLKLELSDFSLQTEQFSLKTLLDDIVALFKTSASTKNLSLDILYDKNIPCVISASRSSVYRIVQNLVGNAIKFTPRGGNITIRTTLKEKTDKATIIQLSVQDTGIGIPKNKQSLIFEKMSRLTPSYSGVYEGHGIGLYMVDKLINNIKGEIFVESTVGKGSTFTINFPAQITSLSETIQKKSFEKKSLEKTNYKTHFPSMNILLVEDNLTAQKITTEILTSIGHKVTIAENGEKALSLFEPGKFDFIYMDIGLPDMDGYAATKLLRKIEKDSGYHIPIFAVTAHAAADVEASCITSGMNGVLSKPLSLEKALEFFSKLATHPQNEGKTSFETPEKQLAPSNQLSKLKIIDLEDGKRLIGGNISTAEAMLQELLRVLPKHEAELNASYKSGDIDLITKTTHKFYGGLCYVGLPRLKLTVKTLLDSLRAGETDKLDSLYKQAIGEIENFKSECQKL